MYNYIFSFGFLSVLSLLFIFITWLCRGICGGKGRIRFRPYALHMVPALFNPLTPNKPYRGCTAPLTSKRCTLYIYSTNIGAEYFKHGIYSPFFPLQNAICFIILTFLVPVLFTFYIQGVLKLKKIIPAPKGQDRASSPTITVTVNTVRGTREKGLTASTRKGIGKRKPTTDINTDSSTLKCDTA